MLAGQLAKNIAVPARNSTMRIAGEYRTYRIAATVAPVTVSGGVARLTATRFQRNTTRMTPKNDSVFKTNAAPMPAKAITKPANAGPTARAKLNSMPFSAEAAGKSSFETSSGKTARHVGVSNASPAESANVRTSSRTGDILPAIVIAASAAATTTIHVSVRRITLRRSTMSPIAPAGSAKMTNGKADAVCVSATYMGPALRDTISQAAPTLCMKVPTSETTSATRSHYGMSTIAEGARDWSERHSPESPCLVSSAGISIFLGRFVRMANTPEKEVPGHGDSVRVIENVQCSFSPGSLSSIDWCDSRAASIVLLRSRLAYELDALIVSSAFSLGGANSASRRCSRRESVLVIGFWDEFASPPNRRPRIGRLLVSALGIRCSPFSESHSGLAATSTCKAP